MTLTLLGTGAAQGVPAAYGRSQLAQRIRRSGGRDLRSRSAARLGRSYQFDIGPDNSWQMHRHELDMYDVEHLLITHTHEDHFQLSEVVAKDMADEANGLPLHVHISEPGATWLAAAAATLYGRQLPDAAALARRAERYPVHRLHYFQRYQIGQITVETVRGNHQVGAGEYAINYLVELPGGKRLLYALDTGYYTNETWTYLEGRRADVIVMDCTFGGRTDRGDYPDGHLDVASFLRQLRRMREIGFADDATRVFASHINPAQGLDHAGLQAAFDASELAVAVGWDGLQITIDTPNDTADDTSSAG